MKDRSTKSIFEFIYNYLLFGAAALIWFNNLLFRCLPGRTWNQSKTVLYVMLGASVVICVFVLNRFNRTTWTVTASLAIPFGIYTLLTYSQTAGVLITVVLSIAAAAVIAHTAIMMSRKIKNSKNRSRTIKRRLYRCCLAAQSITAAALLVVMVIIGARGVFGDNIMISSVPPQKNDEENAQTISSNIDTVLLLQEDEWARLSIDEKLDTLQTVANIEAHYLGLPSELNVGAANLGETTLAQYNDSTHTISVDLDHLENGSAHDVLNSLCHEAYHGYQHRLVDVYNSVGADYRELRLFGSAAEYAEEFSSYEDSSNDFLTYYLQSCEEDAREYAKDAVNDYYSRIRRHLGEEPEY